MKEKLDRKKGRRRKENNEISKYFPPSSEYHSMFHSSKYLQTIIIINFIAFITLSSALPNLSRTSSDPIVGVVGEEILIDCRVDKIENYTIVWRFNRGFNADSSYKNPGSFVHRENPGSFVHRENPDSFVHREIGGREAGSDPKLPVEEGDDSGQVLTVGTVRVTSDPRIDVLHTIGNDVWVLRIKSVKMSDSGVYTCEVNTIPRLRTVRLVTIEPEEESTNVPDFSQVDHNYTDCCTKENVPNECLSFCHLKGLLSEGPSPGTIQSCIHSLPSITKCLADGRNHAPCCDRQSIPHICTPVCVGNFTLTTVVDHFTCMHYTAPVLACIAEGISTLPPQPIEVAVDPVSSSELKVSWKKPSKDGALIESIIMNVTQLESFDSIGVMRLENGRSSEEVTSSPPLYGLQMRFTIPGNETSYLIQDLKPYTMYEIVLSSMNKAGTSLPADRIRVLTLQPESKVREPPISVKPGGRKPSRDREESGSGSREEAGGGRESEGVGSRDREESEGVGSRDREESGSSERESGEVSIKNGSEGMMGIIPDSKKCCRESGTMLERCIDILCDPVRSDEATLTDLMICAPWANITFKCSASGIDHSSCCQQRGVSPNCIDFCRGTVSKIDFRHFVCLDHLPALSSCILDHYGVLPSPPTNFMVVNVHHDWAIIKWSAPKKLASTVLKYHVHWRQISRGDGSDSVIINPRYEVKEVNKSPYLLDGLHPGGRYEVYIKCVNKFGTSEGSSRVVFSTPPIYEDENVMLNNGYNETQCCIRAGLPSKCIPLCSYKVKVIDIIQLASSCSSYLPTLIRCGAGGRNHIPCCRKRGIHNHCLNMCAGLVESSPFVAAARCADELGNMLQCMEEGSGLLPGMPIDFHASLVTKDTIHLEWMPAPEDKETSKDGAIKYQVRFGITDSDIPLHPLEHDRSVNSTKPSVILTGLQPSTRYSMYVVASNGYGISLPSLILVINTTSSNSEKKTMVQSSLGPPHSLQVLHQSVDTITLKWLPPLYVPPDSTVSYIVHYKPVNGTVIESVVSDMDKSAGGSYSSETTTEKSGEEIEAEIEWISIPTTYNTMYLINLTYNTEYAITVQAVTGMDQDDFTGSEGSKNDARRLESSHSEIILVWTDPAIPASVNLPVIIPNGPITEDSNVTFMCIGIGIPTPTLAMLINGQIVTRDERRHLSLTVIGVKRNLTTVSCYASNGIGKDTQSAQSSLEIRVRFKPTATSRARSVSAMNGSPSRLECEYSGNPQPHVIWYKESNGIHVEMQQSDSISFVNVPHIESPSTWINSIVFKSVSPRDDGNYSCTVVNELGQDATSLKLTVDTNGNYTRDASGCCKRQSVKEGCISVCSFDIDMESALSNPECYTEIDKLMACAADGSDHRQCCRRKGVPSDCIRWCAGLRVNRPSLCAISSATDIVSCFEEGRALLPGPPSEVHVKRFLDHDSKVLIEWDPPSKNPELVQWYRVFWRPVGSRDLNRNQTTDHRFVLSDLDSSKMYEFVVKSGNHFGLSVFTDPLVISMSTHSVTTSSSLVTTGNMILKILVGVAVISLAIIVITGAAIYGYNNYYIPRRTGLPRTAFWSFNGRTSSGGSSTNGISFENPSYLKDGLSVHPSDQGPIVQYSNSANANLGEVNANYASSGPNGQVDHLK